MSGRITATISAILLLALPARAQQADPPELSAAMKDRLGGIEQAQKQPLPGMTAWSLIAARQLAETQAATAAAVEAQAHAAALQKLVAALEQEKAQAAGEAEEWKKRLAAMTAERDALKQRADAASRP